MGRRCVRCGQEHTGAPVHPAPRIVRWYAYAGSAALGVLLVPGVEVAGVRPPHLALLAVAGLGCLLVLEMVRPHGGFPRRRLLTVAWPVAGALAVFGTAALAYRSGGAGAFALGVYGWALAAATLSYQRRTRSSLACRRVPGIDPAAPRAAVGAPAGQR